MSKDEAKKNPYDVRVGDEFEDLDKGRDPRRIKVMEVRLDWGDAVVINTKTERMTRVRLDRLAKRASHGHGYERVVRAEAMEPRLATTASDLGYEPEELRQ